MSADLHARLTAAVEARLARAVATRQPSDAIPMSVWEDGFTKVRQELEAEVERYCRRDLDVLRRHAPTKWGEYVYCTGDHLADLFIEDCRELKALAEAYETTTPAEQVDTEEAPEC